MTWEQAAKVRVGLAQGVQGKTSVLREAVALNVGRGLKRDRITWKGSDSSAKVVSIFDAGMMLEVVVDGQALSIYFRDVLTREAA
jgi:hypothetical protein